MSKQWDMTSVDDVIERAIYNFPSLYRHRTEVLANMFLTPGNGYTWVNGVLRNSHYDDHDDYPDEEIGGDYTTLTIPDDMAATMSEKDKADWQAIEADMRAKTDARNAELLAIRANAATLARTPGDPARYLIGWDTHDTRAHTPPADIKPDWEAARLELLAAVEPLWAQGIHILNNPSLNSDYLEAILAHDAASVTPRLTPEAIEHIRTEAAHRSAGISTWKFAWMP